ncbi:cell wall-active antibiotics response protein [Bacteroidales bacterium OttesenSCG-928-B11]|nr:cell wall-active antibiotics response protein [Bacteroidales bacterium OttesenSCG-928-E04]MDL2311346.1 cell wall-active antibiotics response protein [Bacteroidales bacterium OttesenSCG-928-B11]
MRNRTNNKDVRSGIIFGLLLLIVGFVLIFTNTGLLPWQFRTIVFSWQMLLIAIGLFFLSHKDYSFGLIMMGVGTFFILPKLSRVFPDEFWFIQTDFITNYWPILLIVGGAAIIISSFFKPRKRWVSQNRHNHHGEKKRYFTSGDEGFIDKSVVFGDCEHIILEQQFVGGKVSVVFGSMTLDLRKTEIPIGESYLQIEVVFGTLTVIFPQDCQVISTVSTVFGSNNDRRIMSEALNSDRVVVVSGEAVFSTIEIRD